MASPGDSHRSQQKCGRFGNDYHRLHAGMIDFRNYPDIIRTNLKTFARFTLVEDAYLLRSFLGSRDIPASILDEHVPQLFWNYSALIGGVRVVLDSRDDLPAARAAYQEYRSALAQAPVCVSEFRCWPLVLAISLIAGFLLPVFGRRTLARAAEDGTDESPVL